MSNIQPLDNNAHAELRVLARHDAALGDGVNQMPILATEFEEAQRHYPILFMKDESGHLHALAILGFERDENLFLKDGGWDGYIPAIVRRGPFLIGKGETEDPVILVDLDHPRIHAAQAGEGLPVFLEHGGHAPVLEMALGALRAIHVGSQLAAPMQQMFEELGLIEEADITVELDAETAMNFEGYHVVTHERIDALDGAALERLNRAGLLMPAILAASSLYNVQPLVMRKRAKAPA